MSESIDYTDRFAGRDSAVRRYDDEDASSKPPFVFQIGDSPQFVIEEPDTGTVMDIEEARTSRQVLQLFFGDQYGKVEEYLEPMKPNVLVNLARDISRHFDLYSTSAATNRAQRRRRTRGQ